MAQQRLSALSCVGIRRDRRSFDCCRRSIARQIDHNITFHMLVAYSICAFVAIHVGAHCFNFEKFQDAHNSKIGLVTTLSNSQLSTNSTYISLNPITDANSDPAMEVWKSVAGVTGILMTLALILMVSSATVVTRRSAFEVFYYTHHLFLVFFGCLVGHGFGGLIRHQINVRDHDPKVCAEHYEKWGQESIPQCPIPWFKSGSPTTWKWVVAPMVIYVLERLLRRVRAFQTVAIAKVVSHPSSVFELQLQKSSFWSRPGQYVLINCPSLSWLEWHPFTLTSAPDDAYFSVHIRRVGDWTNGLAKACHADNPEFEISYKLPRLCVDGPFGAPSEDYFQYEIDLLIGTGIGVTPFASILKHIWYRIQDPKCQTTLRKVCLVWICRELSMFEWFQSLLYQIESEVRAKNRASFFEYSIYLTRGWDTNQARNIILNDDGYRDPITGLREKTQFGRPQWDTVFTDLVTQHPGAKIGVFFCGSAELSKQLHKKCNEYTMTGVDGTRFIYSNENF